MGTLTCNRRAGGGLPVGPDQRDPRTFSHPNGVVPLAARRQRSGRAAPRASAITPNGRRCSSSSPAPWTAPMPEAEAAEALHRRAGCSPARPSSSRIPLRPSRAVASSVVMSASTSPRPTSGAARLALNSLVVPPVAAAGDGRQSPAHGDERQGTHAPVAGASSVPCSFRTSPLRVFARVPPYGAWGYPNGGGRQG